MSLEPNASTIYWDCEFDSGLQWCADKEDLRSLLGMSVLILRKKLNVDSHFFVTVRIIMYFF